MSVLKDFIRKHMKTDNVIICKELNETIWEKGSKNPPGKVSVVALKSEFAGVEKTLVNLSNIGIDEQSKLYQAAQVAGTAPKTDSNVKEAEVKEVEEEKASEAKEESKEEKKEESKAKEEPKKEEKKTSEKKSAKKEAVKNG